MNAKEAIDLMEKDIDEIVEQINSLTASVMECEAKEDGAGVSYYIARCSRLERILDYKSIVLESAKKLHQDSLIRKFKDDNGEPMIHLLLGNSYDKVEAEKIGLEVEE